MFVMDAICINNLERNAGFTGKTKSSARNIYQMKLIKITSIVFVVTLIINMILFALNKINYMVFWLVIILGAVIAYVVIPKIKSFK